MRTWIAGHKVRAYIGAAVALLAVFAVVGTITGPVDDGGGRDESAATATAPTAPSAAPPPTTATSEKPATTPAPKASAKPPQPSTHTDPNADPVCRGQQWPQPIAEAVGANLSDAASGVLVCFAIGSAVAPDGHDVMRDAANTARLWTITGVQPAPGTLVDEDTPITLTVGPA